MSLAKLSIFAFVLVLGAFGPARAVELSCPAVLEGRLASSEEMTSLREQRPVSAEESAALNHQLTDSIFDDDRNERLTMEVFAQTLRHRREGTDTIVGWLQSIKESEAQHPLDVLEHSALLFIYQSHIFIDSPAQAQLAEALERSYQHLTGHHSSGHDFLLKLPQSVLDRASLNARLMHEALFRTEPGDERLVQGPRAISRNIVTTLTTILGAVTMFRSPHSGANIFFGGLVGLSEAALNEYMVHIGIGHAPPALARAYRRMGRVGEFMEEITLAHRVHHAIVGLDFGSAELTPEQKTRADRILHAMVEGLILDRMRDRSPNATDAQLRGRPEFTVQVAALVENIQHGNYGVDGHWVGAASMLATATPFYLLNFAAYAATGSHEFLVSSSGLLTFMIIQSLYSHFYLHLRPNADRRMSVIDRMQMWYVEKTPIGRLARRLHFAHHDSPFDFDRTRNGVIMAGSMTDRQMGRLHQPTVENYVDMYFQGFLPELQQALRPSPGE